MKRVNLMISAPVESHDSIEAMEKYLREELSDVEGLEVTVTISEPGQRQKGELDINRYWEVKPPIMEQFLAELRKPSPLSCPSNAASDLVRRLLGDSQLAQAANYIASEIAAAMLSHEARSEWGDAQFHPKKGVTV